VLLSDYKITEKICDHRNGLFFRARSRSDDRSVLLKISRSTDPHPEEAAWFCQEYALLQQLGIPGVVATDGFLWNAHQPIMVLQDMGGQSLARLDYGGKLLLSDFLAIALSLARVISQIHQAKISHQDLTPSSLILNPTNHAIQLIDLGVAAQISTSSNSISDFPIAVTQNLAYISPEQTGRTNHSVDYRTDFYSLGIILYELLTGEPPFQGTDALEVIHCHIARQARNPSEITQFANGDPIPAQLSAIVMKLIKKNPNARYQSAHGLVADLERCDREIQAQQYISIFTLATADYKPELHLPNTLFGRQQATQQLLAALDYAPNNTQGGKSELVLVSGEAGVGKSALVQALKPAIVTQQGLFLTGKYDQYQRNVPYSAIVQALTQFCTQILSTDQTELAQWHAHLIRALGNNDQLLSEIVPQLAMITGKPRSVLRDRHQADHANRLHLLFEQLLSAIGEVYRPLVIFLDDLQWADAASLKLIHHLIHHSKFEHLLLIGTYRPEAVAPIDPLAVMLNHLRQHNQICEIVLSPLTAVDVNDLLTETLACTTSTSAPLAELVHRKTNGNPFFVLEFLKSLYTKNLLWYRQSSLQLDTAPAQWEWDITGILAQNTTDNVIALMVEQIQQLQPATRDVMQLAACLGNQFNLADLAMVYEQSPCQTLQAIWPAIAAGLITPLNEQYRLYLTLDAETIQVNPQDLQLANRLAQQQAFLVEIAKSAQFKFQHDRVQEAAYSDIALPDRAALHDKIGRLFLENVTDKPSRQILEIVNHLNQGTQFFTTQTARYELAQLNLEAGQKATDSAAHQTARSYFEQGIRLCDQTAWETQYDLMLALYNATNIAACLSGEFDQQEQISQQILQHTKSWQDEISVTEMKMQACIAQQQFTQAVAIALEFLKQLDIHFPQTPQPEDFQAELGKTLAALQGRSPLTLIDQPPMASPRAIAVLRLLHQIHTALYMSVPSLFPLTIFQEVQLSLEYGNDPLSAPAYVYFGLILCGIIGDIENGYEFGQLAKQLVEQSDSQATRAATFLTIGGATAHWREHIGNTLPIFQEGYQSGVETGDFQSAAFCLELHCSHSFLIGTPLITLAETASQAVKAIGQLHQASPLLFTQIYQQIIVNLLDPDHPTPWEITGAIGAETALIERLQQVNDFSSLGHIYVNKLMLCYWFGEYDQAAELMGIAAPFLPALTGTIMIPLYHFYAALTLLAQYPSRPETQQMVIWEQVQSHQEQLHTWSQFAPMNYTHKWALIEAERLRLLGESWAAMRFYEQAIQGARKHNFLPEASIACEQFALFYRDQQYPDQANYYIQQAFRITDRWQAKAKTQQLERKYLDSLSASILTSVTDREIKVTSRQSLDLSSILKASQALSGEIELKSLLSRLMTIVLENAGAETGILVLSDQGKTAIVAQGHVSRGIQVFTAQPQPLQGDRLPMQLLNYVMRMQNSVVLHHAFQEGDFTDDPYIRQHQTRSILCTPLLNQTKVIGVLYLENNLTPAAFTADRLEVLTLLCSQAAISIKNAQLYEQLQRHSLDLERKVAERTYELRTVNHELQRLALLDGLTQIANRRRFDEYLNQEYWRAQRDQTAIAVILCDVDHFKLFNDRYGHQMGDECLKAIAQLLSQSVKRSVDLVARYGGEEFALILPSTSIDGAITIANDIKANLAALQIVHETSPTHTYVTVSLGISTNQHNGEMTQPQHLLEYADQALYLTKTNGRNGYTVMATSIQASSESPL
jgi:diguanylate cyclase (GGDEF)-like protein